MKFYKKTLKVVSEEELKKKDNLKSDEESSLDILLNEKNYLNVEEIKNTTETKIEDKEEEVEVKKINPLKEIAIVCVDILLLSLFTLLGLLYKYDFDSMFTFGSYSFNKDLLTWGTVLFIGITLVSQFIYFVTIPTTNPPKFKKVSSLIFYIILLFCGIAGFDVLLCIFNQSNYASLPLWASYYLAGVIALLYDYFIVKLFAYDKMSDKKVFWEIVRFALVGVIASVFDFATTYAFRIFLVKTSLSSTIITVIAVTMGFVVGVIVNYLCSVFMVYKASTKSNAKKWYGIILFVVLSAVGLAIGIGLEALFYDYLKWTYILVFIIRTLIVMIWNYISRKIFIFK